MVNAPSGICAVYQDSAGVKSFYYIHTDYLGSWLSITDNTGSLKNQYSYDAWGRPRGPNSWVLKQISTADALTNLNAMQPHFDRGYTGHEIMAGFGLINMNGRLYDPYLQRFLSPDPCVQAPGNAQNYNRYTYCLNNPLMYTDPSGYNFYDHTYRYLDSDGGGGGGGGFYGDRGYSPFAGNLGYTYNWVNECYTDFATGQTVSFDQAWSSVNLPSSTYTITAEKEKRSYIDYYTGSNLKYLKDASQSNTLNTYGLLSSINLGFEMTSDEYLPMQESLVLPSYGQIEVNLWGKISNSILTGAAANQPTYFRSSQIAKEGKFAVDGWKTYSNGFRANQYINSATVNEAKATFNSVVTTTRRISTGLSLMGLGATHLNYLAGNVSFERYCVQQTINGIGLFGPWGAGISIGLGAVDAIWGDQIETWIRK